MVDLQTAGRRLQAGTEATVTVRSTFAGSASPASKVVEAAEKAGCVGIRGLSAVFGNCQLQRGYVADEQIKQPGILLLQQPTAVGEPMSFVATFTEDGQAVSKALPIALTTQPADVLDCSNAPQGGSQVFTCRALLKLDSATVVATGPNPNAPAQRVSATITAFNLSESG